MKQLLLPLLVFLPMGGAILSYVAGRRSERARDALVALVCTVCLAMAGWGGALLRVSGSCRGRFWTQRY